ncbi:hypothetical protein LP419_33505 [Massilia sp. H-1]|nr:hypothetical protein LP419_33505 [Massilia sp. H-1]
MASPRTLEPAKNPLSATTFTSAHAFAIAHALVGRRLAADLVIKLPGKLHTFKRRTQLFVERFCSPGVHGFTPCAEIADMPARMSATQRIFFI